MNCLRLALVPFSYRAGEQVETIQIAEFLIDDKPLTEWLGIERDLGNCDTDLNKSSYDTEMAQRFYQQLTGGLVPSNQFGTDRVVLYRCHCGCDYCGVVSCEIVVQEDTVIWRGVGYEHDVLASGEPWQDRRLEFMFDKVAYCTEITRFLDEN